MHVRNYSMHSKLRLWLLACSDCSLPPLPLYTLFSHFIIHKFQLYKVAFRNLRFSFAFFSFLFNLRYDLYSKQISSFLVVLMILFIENFFLIISFRTENGCNLGFSLIKFTKDRVSKNFDHGDEEFFFFFFFLSLLAFPSRRFHVFASSLVETFLSAISDLAHERDSILCCRWTGRQSSRQREPAFKIVCDVTTLYKIRILGGRYCQLPILRFLLHFHSFLSFVLLAQSSRRLCDWSNFASSFSICYPSPSSFFLFYLLVISKINGKIELSSLVPIKAFDSATVKTRLSTRRNARA